MKSKKMPYADYGYDNYSDLLRKPVNIAIITAANKGYSPWVKYLLKHPECPEAITIKYANSDVWYERIAAVMPKLKFQKYKHFLKGEQDSRVLRYLNRAEEINWPECLQET